MKSYGSGDCELVYDNPICFINAGVLEMGMVLLSLGRGDKLSDAIATIGYHIGVESSFVSHAAMFTQSSGHGWELFESDDSGAGTAVVPMFTQAEGAPNNDWVVLPDARNAFLLYHPELRNLLSSDPVQTTAKIQEITNGFYDVYANYLDLVAAAGPFATLASPFLAPFQRERDSAHGEFSPRAGEGVFCSEAVVMVLQALGCDPFARKRAAQSVAPGELAVSLLRLVPDAVVVRKPAEMNMGEEKWDYCVMIRKELRPKEVGGLADLKMNSIRLKEVQAHQIQQTNELAVALDKWREQLIQILTQK